MDGGTLRGGQQVTRPQDVDRGGRGLALGGGCEVARWRLIMPPNAKFGQTRSSGVSRGGRSQRLSSRGQGQGVAMA